MDCVWCYLGRNVWQASTAVVQLAHLAVLLDLVHCAQTEVADFEGACGIEQEVFRLEVSVNDTLFMDVLL